MHAHVHTHTHTHTHSVYTHNYMQQHSHLLYMWKNSGYVCMLLRVYLSYFTLLALSIVTELCACVLSICIVEYHAAIKATVLKLLVCLTCNFLHYLYFQQLFSEF